jgi:hypothetical protein
LDLALSSIRTRLRTSPGGGSVVVVTMYWNGAVSSSGPSASAVSKTRA